MKFSWQCSLRSWKWRQYISSKHYVHISPHGITTQKSNIDRLCNWFLAICFCVNFFLYRLPMPEILSHITWFIHAMTTFVILIVNIINLIENINFSCHFSTHHSAALVFDHVRSIMTSWNLSSYQGGSRTINLPIPVFHRQFWFLVPSQLRMAAF
jgi:hypothetical protein